MHNVQEDPHRQPRRDCVPHHAHRQSHGCRLRRRLQRGRPQRHACADGSGGALRGQRCLDRQLPARGSRARRGAEERSAGHPPGLRLPVRECCLRRCRAGGGAELHRTSGAGDARHGCQGRVEAADGGGGGTPSSGLPRRGPEPRDAAARVREVRAGRGAAGAAQGRAGWRGQGDAHRRAQGGSGGGDRGRAARGTRLLRRRAPPGRALPA